MDTKHIYISLLLSLFISPSFAQQLSWTKMPFVESGFNVFAIDSNNVYYASVRDSVIYSTDQGKSWGRHSYVTGADNLQVSPYNRLYRFSTNQQLFTSSSIGSFTDTLSGIDKVGSLIFYGDSILLCTVLPVDSPIAFSSNRGQTWSYSESPGKVGIYSLIVSKKGSFIITNPSGIKISRDSCKSWVDRPISKHVIMMESYIYVDSSIVVGTHNGIYISNNDGESWDSLAFGNHRISYMCKDTNGYWYAVVSYWDRDAKRDPSAGLYSSSDNGNSWIPIFPGAPPFEITMLQRDRNNAIVFSTYINGTLKIPEYGAQPKRLAPFSLPTKGTQDLIGVGPNGVDFIIEVNANSTMFSNSNYDVCKSTDTGKLWVDLPLTNKERNPFDIVTLPNGKTYHVTIGDFAYSSNKGESWTQKNYPPEVDESVLAFTVAKNGDLYIGSDNGSVYRSTNNGSTWTGKYNIFSTTVTSILECNSGTFLLFTIEGIYKSKDKGGSWQELTNIQNKPSLRGTIRGVAPWGDVFVLVDSFLFRSTNEGSIWTKTNMHKVLNSVVFDGAGLFLGAESGEILQSKNKGLSFTVLTGNLPVAIVTDLALDSNGFLYAYLYDSKAKLVALYKTIIPYFKSVDADIKYSMAINSSLSIYPNPTTDFTSFSYTLDKPSFVTSSLVDIQGRVVKQQSKSWMDAGSHEMQLDVSDLPNGVYTVLLRTNDELMTTKLVVSR